MNIEYLRDYERTNMTLKDNHKKSLPHWRIVRPLANGLQEKHVDSVVAIFQKVHRSRAKLSGIDAAILTVHFSRTN